MFATRLQMQVAKLVSGLFDRYSLLRHNNMATNLQRFSYGRRRFASCDCWTQTTLAENAARQWLLTAVSLVVLCCVVWKQAWMKKNCYDKRDFCDCFSGSWGVTRLDGARGKKQVWRPRVRAWGLFGSKCRPTVLKEVFVTLLGLHSLLCSDLEQLAPP